MREQIAFLRNSWRQVALGSLLVADVMWGCSSGR